METKYLNVDDNIKLAYFEKYNEMSKVGIIFVHGLAEHKGRYEYFIDKIKDMSLSVFALDIRGHGESEGKRGYIDNFRTFLTDLDIFVNEIKKEHPNLKLALMGHSLGGLIATSYVATHNSVDYLILSSPLLNESKLNFIFHFIPYKMLGFIKVKKRHSESPEMLEYSYKDPLSTKYMTLRLLGSVFKQGLSFVKKQFKNVNIPTLLLGGELDPLIKTKKFDKILSKFGSGDKQLKIYKNTKHRLLQSESKDTVIDDIVNWLTDKK